MGLRATGLDLRDQPLRSGLAQVQYFFKAEWPTEIGVGHLA